MKDYLYEKCALCHLFVEENYVEENFGWQPDSGIAEYVHLHRGDKADEAIDESHEATPSGEKHTLDYWKVNGPKEMRKRFLTESDDLTQIILVYWNEDGEISYQNLADLQDVGTLIDPDSGDDLELIGWKFAE